MQVYLYAAVALVLFICGSIIIKRRIKPNIEDDVVVPISDLDEISRVKRGLNSAEDSVSAKRFKETFTLSDHIMNENFKKDHSGVEKHSRIDSDQLKKYESDAKEKDLHISKLSALIEELTEKNIKLEKAIERELSSKETTTLSEEEKERLLDKENKYSLAQKSIESLTDKNVKSNNQLEEQIRRVNELEEEVETIKSGFNKDLADENSKYMLLEKDKIMLGEMNEVLLEKVKVMDELKAHNNILINKNSELEKKLAELNIIIEKKNEESKAFDDDFKGLKEDLEREVEKLKVEVEGKHILEKRVNILEGELNEKGKVLNSEKKDVGFKIQQLEKDKEELYRNILELELNINKLNEYNSHLLTKEKVLQFELTKNRAKALGFEKICEDFKVRIDMAEEKTANV